MSKKAANGELRPFSSTSFHQWLSELAMHMWFGTTSMISPMPRCFSAADNASRSPSVPISGFRCAWSMTS